MQLTFKGRKIENLLYAINEATTYAAAEIGKSC